MQPIELTRAATKIAELMEYFSRQSQGLAQQSREITHALTQTAQSIPGLVKQSAEGAVGGISKAVLGQVQQGLSAPIDGFNRQMLDTASGVNNAAHGLKQQVERLDALHHALVWKVLTILLGSFLILLCGGAWLLWQYKGEIQRNSMEAEFVGAFNRADVKLCDGRLCVRTEKKNKRHGEYVLVKPR